MSRYNHLVESDVFVYLHRERVGAGDNAGSGSSFSSYSALPEDFRTKLELRSKQIDSIEEGERSAWNERVSTLVLARGRARLLDPDVHPEQVAEFLRGETGVVQAIIERNLPGKLAEKVAVVLRSSTLFSYVKRGGKKDSEYVPPEVLVEVIKRRFLAQFISREQLITRRRYDRFSMKRLGNLIWRLGLSEIKRGLTGVEKEEEILDAFESTIVEELSETVKAIGPIDSERAILACDFVNDAVSSARTSDDRIRKIGLQLLAIDLSQREPEAARYSIQKLPSGVGGELATLVESPRDARGFESRISEEIDRESERIEREVR